MLSHTKKRFNDEKISKIWYQIKKGRGVVVLSFKMACLILKRQFNGGDGGGAQWSVLFEIAQPLLQIQNLWAVIVWLKIKLFYKNDFS